MAEKKFSSLFPGTEFVDGLPERAQLLFSAYINHSRKKYHFFSKAILFSYNALKGHDLLTARVEFTTGRDPLFVIILWFPDQGQFWDFHFGAAFQSPHVQHLIGDL